MDFEQIERRNKLEAARFKHDLHMRLIESEHRCAMHIIDTFRKQRALADSDQHSSTEDNRHDDRH